MLVKRDYVFNKKISYSASTSLNLTLRIYVLIVRVTGHPFMILTRPSL